MCHYQTVRNAICGHFSKILVYPCAVGISLGHVYCRDQREDQGTRQDDTLCPNCKRREGQAHYYGGVAPGQALLAEVKRKARGAVSSRVKSAARGGNLVGHRGGSAGYGGNPAGYGGCPAGYEESPVDYGGYPAGYEDSPVEYEDSPVDYGGNTCVGSPANLGGSPAGYEADYETDYGSTPVSSRGPRGPGPRTEKWKGKKKGKEKEEKRKEKKKEKRKERKGR